MESTNVATKKKTNISRRYSLRIGQLAYSRSYTNVCQTEMPRVVYSKMCNSDRHHAACMTAKDPAFEARSILSQLERQPQVESVLRTETRLGWEDDAFKRASTFVAKLNEEQATLSPESGYSHMRNTKFGWL